MIDRLKHSMRALQMLMKAQEVTANNLANINTPGFKGDKLFYRAFMNKLNGRPVSDVEPHQTIQMQQGAFEPTGNTFDFAIEGDAFFEVSYEGNRYLTRNGRFSLDADGFLVDDQGAQVMGEGGAIHLPQLVKNGSNMQDLDIEVAKDGTFRVNGLKSGKLSLVSVDEVHRLERRTHSYLQVPEDVAITTDTDSRVVQGFYESGNVDPLKELVDMTRNMRMFESQQKVMTTTDELLSRATTRLGRF